jgi:DNA-directed RNA polymerase specialized sigma24 family protein
MERKHGRQHQTPPEGAGRRYNPVSERDVAAFASTTEALHLQRLEADQRLMLRLQNEGFGGRAWDEVSRALAEYGYAVMVSWIRSGRVFAQLRERGMGGPLLSAPTGGVPLQDARDIASDTVTDAIINFRDRVLAAARWDPGKGASLATYFVGNCLLRFPNVFRRWRRRWDAERSHLSLAEVEDLVGPLDPAAEAVGDVAAQELLGRMDPASRMFVILLLLGLTHREIASRTGVTTKSVESRLYRLRKEIDLHGPEGFDASP